MDKKKTKRQKLRTLLVGHGQGRSAVKKAHSSGTSDKEEQERLEAANILSSLKFMTPGTPEVSKPDPNKQVTSKSSTVNVTQFPATWTTGISTHSTPSVRHHGKQLSSGGSGTAKSLLTPAVLAQLAQIQTIMGTTIVPSFPHQLLSSILTLQTRPVAKTQTSQSKVPSVVMSAEPSRLPLTVNPVKTVNKTVASALRQAVAQNTTKQNPDSVVMKSMIKEKLQKKISDEVPNGSENPDPVSNTSEEKLDSVSKKKDTVETSLPLKKRRLVSLLDNQVPNLESSRLSDLTSSVHMDNILNLARDYPDPSTYQTPSAPLITAVPSAPTEGYRPVSFDPRTSLLVLSDLKTALTPDEDGDLPIHIAVVHENTELVKKFIDIMAMSGKSVDRYNKLQQTPLHLAVLVNKPDIVEALLGAKADPNLVDRNGCTSQHIAITKQFPSCLRTIFAVSQKRVEVNTRNYEGYSPLHTTVENGDLEAMRFLNEQGAQGYINLNIQDGKAGRSVLFYATEYKQVEMVEYLVDCGVSVDLQNYAGISPLMTAQAGRFEKITELLTRALELKMPEEGYLPQTKKFPIAPIPSKAKQIAPDSPMTRSRSNSVSCDTKPAPVSRTSSTSSSSPMDLSLHSKNKSSTSYQARRSRQSSTDSEMKDKVSNSMKHKHAQIIAALEGRNVSKMPQSVASVLESVQKANALYDGHKISSLPETNTEKDGWIKVNIKEEPMDSYEDRSIDIDRIKEQIGPVSVVTLNALKSGKDIVSEKSAPNLEDVSNESLDCRVAMETVHSPSMPVLSRAVSLTETAQSSSRASVEMSKDTEQPGSVLCSDQGPQTVEKGQQDRINSDMLSKILPESKEANPSPTSSSADISVEMPMEVDTINNDVELDKKVTEIEVFQNSSNKNKSLDQTVDSDSGGSEIDINAIEMDAEHEEGEEVEGSLVIDETVVDDMDLEDSNDSKPIKKQTERHVNEQTGSNDSLPFNAQTENNESILVKEKTGSNDSLPFKAQTENNENILVKEKTGSNDSIPFKAQMESNDCIQVDTQTESNCSIPVELQTGGNDSIAVKAGTESNDGIPVKAGTESNDGIPVTAGTESNDSIKIKEQTENNDGIQVKAQKEGNDSLLVTGQTVGLNTPSHVETELEKPQLYEESNERDNKSYRNENMAEVLLSGLPSQASLSHLGNEPRQLRGSIEHSASISELPHKGQEEITISQTELETEPEVTIDESQEKKYDKHFTCIEDKNDVIDLDSPVNKQVLDQVELHRGDTSDKDSNKDSVFPVGHSRTLYVGEGDNYKPIKIFIDGSLQSSLVLQRMLHQTNLMHGAKRDTLPLVHSGEILARNSNNSMKQHIVNTSPGLVDNSESGSDFTNNSVQSVPVKTLAGSSTTTTSKQLGVNITNKISAVKSGSTADKPSTRETLLQNTNIRLPISDTIPALINSLEISNASNVKKPTILLPVRTEIRTSISSNSDKTVPNIEAGVAKTMEQLKDKITIIPATDFSDKMGIDSKESQLQVKPGLSKKPSTITSVTTNRKSGLTATPQSKVSTTLPSRTSVSTSEGTLTRVNPDIKSRLSKALQSPQRKLSAKGTVVGPDMDFNHQTTRGNCTNLMEEHSNNVQIVTVSDIRP